MRAARRQGVLGGGSLRNRAFAKCVLAPPLFNIFFVAAINVTYTRFKADKDIMDALVHPRKKKRAEGRGKATAGEPVLVTLLWGMLYADNAGVVS